MRGHPTELMSNSLTAFLAYDLFWRLVMVSLMEHARYTAPVGMPWMKQNLTVVSEDGEGGAAECGIGTTLWHELGIIRSRQIEN